MTSRNSFFDLLIENTKQRLWAIALSILGFIFAFPIYTAMMLSTWKYRLLQELTTRDDIILSFGNKITGMGNVPLIILIIGLAAINGLQSMAHLLSRNKSDFYASIPVKRNKLFSVSYLNGVLIFIIPYLPFLIISLIIGGANGYVTGETVGLAFASFISAVVIYTVIYTTVVLACILTGNIIVSVIGSGVLLFWPALIAALVHSYMSSFFITYCDPIMYAENTSYNSLRESSYMLFSPVLFIIKCNSAASDCLQLAMPERSLRFIITYAIVSVLLIAVCVVLYNKRPSEAAGHAMAFKITKPFIKVILMVPASSFAGLLFYSIVGNSSAWLIFGIISGLVLSHAIIEIIYEFDFKACIHHFASAGVAAAITVFAICFFIFDISGYDRYMPKASDVSSAALACSSLQSSVTILGENNFTIDNEYYRTANMKLKDIDDVLTLAENGVSFASSHRNNFNSTADTGSDNTAYTIIRWRLNNGRSVYRAYSIDYSDDTVFKAYDSIYATREYKDAVFPVLTADDSQIKNLYYSSPVGETKLSLNTSEMQKILDTYRTELYMQQADILKSEAPIGFINTHVGYSGSDMTDDVSFSSAYECYIYPSFTKTIALLKDAGTDVYGFMDTSNMNSIDVTNYDSNGNSTSKTYKDPSAMEQIIKACVPADYFYMNSAVYAYKYSSYDVQVDYKTDEVNNDWRPTSSMILLSDMVPNFVAKDVPVSDTPSN